MTWRAGEKQGATSAYSSTPQTLILQEVSSFPRPSLAVIPLMRKRTMEVVGPLRLGRRESKP